MDEFENLLAAGKVVENRLLNDPSLVSSEADLQVQLQEALKGLYPKPVPCVTAPQVLRYPHHPAECLIPRVFRELNVKGSQSGGETDLVVLGEGPQIIEAKQNGAPARFRAPYAALIEAKLEVPVARRPCLGQRIKTDLSKWRDPGLGPSYTYVCSPVAEHYSTAFPTQVVAIRRPGNPIRTQRRPGYADGRRLLNLGDILEVERAAYAAAPFSRVREKDFESNLIVELRKICDFDAAVENSDGDIVGWADPVHSQIKPAAGLLPKMGRRRHDIVVASRLRLSEDKSRLSVVRGILEIELKTSHSNSHNWFCKPEVDSEFRCMHKAVQDGYMQQAMFVMFRYGPRMWDADAVALNGRWPLVDLHYLDT